MNKYNLQVNDETLALLQACVEFSLYSVRDSIDETEDILKHKKDVMLEKQLRIMESIKTDLCFIKSMMKHEYNKRIQWN